MPLPGRSGGSFLSGFGSSFPQNDVEVIRDEGTPEERRLKMRAIIQRSTGQFNADAQIFDGDIVELDDPRGGKRRLYADKVDIIEGGGMSHISVTWGKRPVTAAPTALPSSTSNVYNGPVIHVTGDRAQIAWNNEQVSQAQGSQSITPGYEGVAKVVSEVLAHFQAAQLDEDDKSIARESADTVLHEVVKASPNHTVIKRCLAALRGIGSQVTAGIGSGMENAAHDGVRSTLEALAALTLPN
jgi:hypothetical protein